MSRSRDPVWPPASVAPISARLDDVPFEVDALRGELYRLLDQLARAAAAERDGLLEAFDEVWRQYREAIASRR